MNSGNGTNEGSREERPPDANPRDLVEALAEEYFDARRRGTAPTPSDFSARAGERSDELRQILEAACCLEDAADLMIPRGSDVPPRLGRYRILRTIGRGGMGVVCEAVDEELGRHVALKILKSERADDPTDVERFQLEARAAARLSHPHIVSVFGADSCEGRRFHVMQLVAGRSVSELLRAEERSGPRPAWLAPENVARLGLDVSEALAYAHAEGVLHRDLKPSNLLLDRSGCIWVADFGLAKLSEGEAVTKTGDVVGTPRYLAPEALSGQSDHRTDVYGVGITLYEMLARRPAFTSNEPNVIFQQVLYAQPPRLRRLDPTLPVDLETIVHKCIEKEPTDRFASARELAADLRRFLAGEPIVARRPTWSHRAWLFGRRHRAAVAIAMAAGVLLVATLVAWIVTLHASNLRERARSDALSKAIGEKDAALGDAFRQRGRAEANLATATAAIDRFLARLGDDQLVLDPKYQTLRTAYLEDALRFLNEMLGRGEDSSSVAAQTATTLRRLASVERMLGHTAEAAAHAERALDLLGGTPSATAPTLAAAEWIRASWVAGQLAQERGDYARAERQFRDALSIRLAAPADVETLELLLSIRAQLAQLCQQGGDPTSASAEFGEVLRQGNELAAAGHASVDVRRNLRFAEYGIGDIARWEGRLGDARTHFEASMKIALDLGVSDPGDRWRLNVVRCDLGVVRIDTGEPAAGRAEQERAIQDQEGLAQSWPAIPQFRLTLARMHTFFGLRLKQLFDRAGARRELKRALELHEQLASELPSELNRLQNRVEAAISLGAIEDEEEHERAARDCFADALRWLEERSDLLTRYPALTDLRLLALSNLALVEESNSAGIAAANEAIRSADRIRAEANNRSFDRSNLDRALIALGHKLLAEKRFVEAEEAASRLLRELHAGGAPTTTAIAEALTSQIDYARGDLEAGDDHCRRAIEIREKWETSHPRDVVNLLRLADDLDSLVRTTRERGEARRARELAQLAVMRVRAALLLDPGFQQGAIKLACHVNLLAQILFEDGELDGAAKAAEEAGSLAPGDAEILVGSARVFAECSAAAADRDPGEGAEAGRADRWSAAAIAQLEAAFHAGFRDVRRCEETPAFDVLVERDDYVALLDSMRKADH